MNTRSQSNTWAGWFSGPTDADLKVQLSRHRFVYAGVPVHSQTWAAIQREYAQIMAAREAVAS